MGLFSKLFQKKESTAKSEIKVTITAKMNNETYEPDIPPYQGDYAKTIFLWAHDKASAVRQNDDYARYFLYECGILNPSVYHKELIRDGYFEKAPVTAVLDALKVADLKQILSSINQSTTGKKDALIERIIETADDADLKSICNEELYILSELGKSFLKKHDDYVLVHKHKNWGIDWKEYDLQHRPGYSFYDTVWGIFNKRVIEDNQNFGRNSYLNMYQLLEEEGKRERAIEMLLRVLYIDLSGVCGMNCYQMFKQGFYTEEELIEYFNIAIMFAPGIVKPIADYENVYNDSIIDRLYEWKLPIQICSKELFINLVHSVIDGSYDEEKFEAQLKEAYVRFVKKL